MADGAHLRIATAQTVSLEPRAVRIEAAPSHRGVASETIAFGVTGDAALQALAGGRAVGEKKARLRVVEPPAEWALRRESRLLVTVGAERACTVTLAA